MVSRRALIECFIPKTRANNTLEASSDRKRRFDPSLQGRKPDFVVHTSIEQRKAYLVVAEFKSAKRWKSSRKELWSDLVKLGNEMKDAIDKIVKDGVKENVVVCGLLAEGKLLCSLGSLQSSWGSIGSFHVCYNRLSVRRVRDGSQV